MSMGINELRDECFKTAEWAKHNNGVGTPHYEAIGYDDDWNIVYSSGCPTCKERKDPQPHHVHANE